MWYLYSIHLLYFDYKYQRPKACIHQHTTDVFFKLGISKHLVYRVHIHTDSRGQVYSSRANRLCCTREDSFKSTGKLPELPLSNFFPVGSMSFTSKISSTKMPAILHKVCKHSIQLMLWVFTACVTIHTNISTVSCILTTRYLAY